MNLGSDLRLALPSAVFLQHSLWASCSLVWHWQYTSRLGVDGTQHRFQASTLCRISEALQRQQGVKPHAIGGPWRTWSKMTQNGLQVNWSDLDFQNVSKMFFPPSGSFRLHFGIQWFNTKCCHSSWLHFKSRPVDVGPEQKLPHHC